MQSVPKILLVEDSPSLAAVYQEYLRKISHKFLWADSLAKARELYDRHAPELVLLDLKLPDGDGLDLLHSLNSQGSPSAVIVITAHSSVDAAIEAMRLGAVDFIAKPFDAKRLLVTVQNTLKQRELSDIVEQYRECYDREDFFGFIGASRAMQGVYRIIESAAPSAATVFITGDSGTGKELCARAIHQESPRRDKPFIALNCAAIPRDLIESEIFGHVKGAFTGAVTEREGAAVAADGGTLFLDELCEMDLDLQSKLLRFIQTGQVQKVGTNQVRKVDVRFVCATNRNPLREVEEGRFREDLYYRLHVIPIALPALREREQDVVLIARRLLRQFAEEEHKAFTHFSPEVERVFCSYAWPGNVRQVQNVVRNLVVLNQAAEVTLAMLPPPLNEQSLQHERPNNPLLLVPAPAQRTEPGSEEIKPLWMVERDAIERAIALCGGNIPKAAAYLEVSPSTLYRKKTTWEQC
ncbi:sigma-54-dependent transcriptional regulator [Pseudomonas sp.]|jgi:two-component system repressor protein LuxO|uniref:sigma-54-dependent transcriptional regulator n=1 Tax=Pseudomonas sp. TaxID=306 RepID=UPI0037C5E16B